MSTATAATTAGTTTGTGGAYPMTTGGQGTYAGGGTGTGAQAGQGGKAGTRPYGRNTAAWRSSFLSPLLYFLGAVCWFVGGCLNTENPRTGYDFDDGQFNAGFIIYIIAAILFILAAMVSLVSAFAEARMVQVGGRTPGIGRLLVLAAWHELLGSILLLIGAAIFLGGSGSYKLENLNASNNGNYIGRSRTASTGSIIMMIGSFIWLVGQLLYTVIALIVASVTALMPEMVHRQRAWFSIASTLFFLIGWIFFMAAMCAYVTLTGPGFMLFGSLMIMVASALWMVSFLARLCGAYYYFVPVLGFATAAAATSGLVAGTAAQAGITAAGMSTGATKGSGMTQTGEAKSAAAPMMANTGMQQQQGVGMGGVQQQGIGTSGATQAHLVPTETHHTGGSGGATASGMPTGGAGGMTGGTAGSMPPVQPAV